MRVLRTIGSLGFGGFRASGSKAPLEIIWLYVSTQASNVHGQAGTWLNS